MPRPKPPEEHLNGFKVWITDEERAKLQAQADAYGQKLTRYINWSVKEMAKGATHENIMRLAADGSLRRALAKEEKK